MRNVDCIRAVCPLIAGVQIECVDLAPHSIPGRMRLPSRVFWGSLNPNLIRHLSAKLADDEFLIKD